MTEHPSSSGEEHGTVHQPVLLRETLQFLDLQPGLIVVDGTVGAGGHSRHILPAIEPGGRLIGLDRDPAMLQRAAAVLKADNCQLIHADYSQLRHILDELHVEFADRILLDLGISSDQLAEAQRGFGFESAGPLDLRFDPGKGQPAWQLLATASQDELEEIFRTFGEERHSRRIAGAVVRRRSQRPLCTARELAELVRQTVPRGGAGSRIHPATRIFQALRIAVNNELQILEETLHHVLPASLCTGGRAVIISFHSLEDRLVKSAFRDKKQWHNLTPKPITATETEKKVNPRSRSAKLRAAEKR